MSTTSKKGRQNRRNSSSNTVTPSPRMFTATASINTSTVHSQFSSMFHACQESAMLSAEFQRRGQAGYEQKRHAEFQRYMLLGSPDRIPRLTNLPRQHLPSKIRMTMEVQCSDFASLFDGREAWAGNDSIAVIMRDIRCMVQFANQHEERTEKMGIFNQVTITADNIADLDDAMLRIRAFCPLTIAVPLINLKEEHAKKDPVALIRQWCQGEELRDFDRVQFSVLNPPLLFMTAQNGGDPNSQSLVIRASRKDSQLMVTASDVVCRLLFKEPRPTFYACLRIPASQRKMIAGSPDGVLIRTISTQTKAVIHYAHRSNKSPSSPSSSPAAPTSTNYFLSGRAAAINQAIKALQDISPVRIEYEVENRHLARGPDVGTHRELDMFDIERAVIVQLRRSPYEGGFRLGQEEMRHSLTLMTSEENALNLYKVRQNLLTDHFLKQEPAVERQPNRRQPQYMEYLRVLVLESSMRAYIGEGRVVTVCRCNSNEHQHNHQQQKPAQANGGSKREEEEGGEEAGEEE